MLSTLSGVWIFSSIIYLGQPMAKPNPDLVIVFDFTNPTVDSLTYYRKNEAGFCQRKAQYTFDGSSLTQTVLWINPENASFCSQDSDMQLGNQSRTPLSFQGQQMRTEFPLGQETITYVWDLQEDKK